MTSKRGATPESLREEFNEIVVELDILKEKYFSNERKDFPLFMCNHYH